jgi:hypothetical protein
MIAKRLSLPVYHYTYYRDVRVWIPDLQYGKNCMPACPCCTSKARVTIHGFHSKHYGQIIVGLTEIYYIISRQYQCEGCRKKSDEAEFDLENSEQRSIVLDQ